MASVASARGPVRQQRQLNICPAMADGTQVTGPQVEKVFSQHTLNMKRRIRKVLRDPAKREGQHLSIEELKQLASGQQRLCNICGRHSCQASSPASALAGSL